MSPSDRAELLYAIKQVVLGLSSLPGEVGLETGTCYCTVGYQLNIRIYEKLLIGMFDILDESQLIEVCPSALGITCSVALVFQFCTCIIFSRGPCSGS